MRYIIGIDLGTTNSCVFYVDKDPQKNPRLTIQPFRIPQLTSMGVVESESTLPSFCYLAASYEFPSGTLKLPWGNDSPSIVGQFAQQLGAKTPTRLVQSAKSWLCNSTANRKDPILPINAADLSQRISPLEATRRYLTHIKDAWNSVKGREDPQNEFEQQEIVLTVPASFDEVARTLTAEAAKLAGFQNMTLLEEPQAAFYSWISQHEKNWEELFQVGDVILVCDVGGGTTDFSLIVVNKKGDKLQFERMAVGDHLLLGGDNMDAAICHYLEHKLNKELDTTQWSQLMHQGRYAKEQLLKEDLKESTSHQIQIQGTGSKVVQGSLSLEVERSELLNLLLSGFFASCPWEEALKLKSGSGIRTMGLPYEEEPSIIKHLAHFLNQNAIDGKIAKPNYILFNGGSMKPTSFRQSIVQSLNRWFPDHPMQELESASLDLAVARGAAYYGKVRQGLGVRIGGGSARGYYLEIETKDSQPQALTLLPRGSEEGSTYEPTQTFWLTPNTPIAFRLYSSHVRLHDVSGNLIPIDPQEMQPLPPIHTVLRFGKETQDKIPVHLGIGLTAIGTLEMWLKSQKTEHQWNLAFQIRAAGGQDNSLATLEKSRSDETFDTSYLTKAEQVIKAVYVDRQIKPDKIMEKLEEILEKPRREWSPSLLRGLWNALFKCASHRTLSVEHDARWWNLIGFFLRPGFGYPLDDFRMKELWKVILGDLQSVKSPEGQIQRWICYRRIAGGLNKGQQQQLANLILADILDKRSGKIAIKKSDLYAYAEKIRALAAMELMEIPVKIRLGQALLKRIESTEGNACDYWALGRLGARHLLYGSLAHVIPADTCSQWIEILLAAKDLDQAELYFLLGQLARKTDHREFNISEALSEKVLSYFQSNPQLERLEDLLQTSTTLTQSEQEQLFGDRLPVGLSLDI